MGRPQRAAASVAQGETSIELYARGSNAKCVFDSRVVAALRRMLTSVVYQSELPRTVAFTSALQGEGVTYMSLATSATLAHDLAARVCLVDLNWWRPGVDRFLTTTESRTARRRASIAPEEEPRRLSRGIAAVLHDGVPLETVTVATNYENMDVLPAGKLTPAQRAVIARSDVLANLVRGLFNRYDHVILDVPAVRLTSDAVALASLADAVALVVRQGVTPTGDVKQALDELKHLRMMGTVLNKNTFAIPKWLYSLVAPE
jgi:Mrp family chromosome partitioning ATPase